MPLQLGTPRQSLRRQCSKFVSHEWDHMPCNCALERNSSVHSGENDKGGRLGLPTGARGEGEGSPGRPRADQWETGLALCQPDWEDREKGSRLCMAAVAQRAAAAAAK